MLQFVGSVLGPGGEGRGGEGRGGEGRGDRDMSTCTTSNRRCGSGTNVNVHAQTPGAMTRHVHVHVYVLIETVGQWEVHWSTHCRNTHIIHTHTVQYMTL